MPKLAGKQRSYGSKVMTGKAAHCALAMLLAGCRDDALAGFTAEYLARHYKVPLPKCSEMLARAKRERGV